MSDTHFELEKIKSGETIVVGVRAYQDHAELLCDGVPILFLYDGQIHLKKISSQDEEKLEKKGMLITSLGYVGALADDGGGVLGKEGKKEIRAELY